MIKNNKHFMLEMCELDKIAIIYPSDDIKAIVNNYGPVKFIKSFLLKEKLHK